MLRLENITKKYAGITALSNVNISFEKGKIHSVIGENGAGKSTLVNIITGAVPQTEGKVIFKNETLKMNPITSKNHGILPVYQELNLIDELKVYENIFYGKEISTLTILDVQEMKKQAKKILDTLGVEIDIEEKVKNLGIGSKQIVEIAKAIISNPKVILFDEPTASLSETEILILHEIISNLVKKEIAVIFVSHKLDEVLKISDEISVLRDGKLVVKIKREEKNNWNIENLVNHMLGKESREKTDLKKSIEKKEALRLVNVSNRNVSDINLELYFGEILCLYGQLGSGRSELLNSIFGVTKIEKGEIFVNNIKKNITDPITAIENSIGLITEDRKDSGLFLNASIIDNVSITSLKEFKKGFSIDRKKEESVIEALLKKLDVKYYSLNQKVKELSGGNQQKILIAKWLLLNPNIILLDEPTRGVDVGAKEEIYSIIKKLAGEGKAILVVSSEIEEIIRLADRTFVFNNGKIISKYDNENIDAEKLIRDSLKSGKEVKVDN